MAASVAPTSGVVALVTLFDLFAFGWGGPRLSGSRVWLSPGEIASSLLRPEGFLNVLLFVPVRVFASLSWRRPLRAVALGAAVSMAVEVVQGVGGGTPACTSVDVVANIASTAVGVAVAVFVLVVLGLYPGRAAHQMEHAQSFGRG